MEKVTGINKLVLEILSSK